MKKFGIKPKHKGPVLAVLLVLILILVGFYLGRYISMEYQRRNNNTETIFNVILRQTTTSEIQYILTGEAQTINELCGMESGLCEKALGRISLNRVDIDLRIAIDLDNPALGATIQMNNHFINVFGTLDRMIIMDERYLVFTELLENNNYVIHVYNHRGQQLISYISNINEIEFGSNYFYFEYCYEEDYYVIEANEEEGIEEEILHMLTRYRINANNITRRTTASSEYQNCAQ